HEGLLLCGVPVDGKSPATESAGRRRGHTRDEGSDDGGVDGAAATVEHSQRVAYRIVTLAGNRSAPAGRRSARRRRQQEAAQEGEQARGTDRPRVRSHEPTLAPGGAAL